MGFYTEFVFNYKGVVYYMCERDGFEKYADRYLEKLICDLILYKDYIVNMLTFLNIDRSDNETINPRWFVKKTLSLCGDNLYFIDLNEPDDSITINDDIDLTKLEKYNRTRILRNIDTNAHFVRFLNERFLCNKIWHKYNIPKDIANYIHTNFF